MARSRLRGMAAIGLAIAASCAVPGCSTASKHGAAVTESAPNAPMDAERLAKELLDAIEGDDLAKLKASLKSDKRAIDAVITWNGHTPLLEAIARRKEAIASYLIGAGASLGAVDDNGETALMYAARAGMADTERLLVKKGADVGAVNELDETALYLASTYEAAEALLMGGAALERRDAAGRTALYKAAIEGRLDSMEALIAAGADVDSKDKNGSTALNRITAEKGTTSIDIVKRLLDARASIDAKDGKLRTPLINSLLGAKWEIALALLDRSPDLDARDIEGNCAASAAIAGGRKEVIDAVLGRGARIGPGSAIGEKMLLAALRADDALRIEYLLKAGVPADAYFRNYDPERPIAPGSNVLELIVKNGIGADGRLPEGITLLEWAIKNGMNASVDMLLRSGADAEDGAGNDALDWAVRSGNLISIERLLAGGLEYRPGEHAGTPVLAQCIGKEPTEFIEPSGLDAVTTDGAGNIYVAGSVTGTSMFLFGRSASIEGSNPGSTAVIAKYDRSGRAIWVNRVAAVDSSKGSGSAFDALCVDPTGGVVAVGWIEGGECELGNGVKVSGYDSDYMNASRCLFIAKYGEDGAALWASSSIGPAEAEYGSVAVDRSGSSFACGYASRLGNPSKVKVFTLGNGISFDPHRDREPLLVKYDRGGRPMAASIPSAAGGSGGDGRYTGIIAGAGGELLACGEIRGAGATAFAPGVSVEKSRRPVAMVVAFDSNCAAKSVVALRDDGEGSGFRAIAAGSGGSAFAVGTSGDAQILVKLEGMRGVAWQKTLGAKGALRLNSICVAGDDSVFVGGEILSSDSGSSASRIRLDTMTSAVAKDGKESARAMLAKYDASGSALGAWDLQYNPGPSAYTGLVADPEGFVFAVGRIAGTGIHWFGGDAKHFIYVFDGNIQLEQKEDGEGILVKYLR